MQTFEWVTLQKAAEQTGYTPGALRQKIKRSVLAEGTHWKRAADNRILINVKAFNQWMAQ